MWKSELIENKETFVDLRAPEKSVTFTKFPLTTAAISTVPAIAHMIMTPNSRATNKPQAIICNTTDHSSCMSPKQDHLHLRLQRDLNSPSAALHMRALRALKSTPGKTTYCNFDVSHTEQSIITADERNPNPPPSLSEILQNVIVYVEVRTGNDNRSEGVKSIIAKMGAQVSDRLLRNTTHVVFKDGLLSTYKRARSLNIPVVSILWIEACKVQRRICEPQQFPISNIHMYEFPELYGKVTRVRCMQPDSELNKRSRKRKETNVCLKDKENNKQINSSKNELKRFLIPLSQNKHLAEDELTESPATKLLNRISSGCFMPHLVEPNVQNANSSPADSPGDISSKNAVSQNSSTFNDGKRGKTRSTSLTVEPAHLCRPERTSRRYSSSSTNEPSLALFLKGNIPRVQQLRRKCSLKTASHNADTEENFTQTSARPKSTTRRCSLQLIASPEVNKAKATCSFTSISTNDCKTPKLLKKPSFQSIAEEMVDTLIIRKDNYMQQSDNKKTMTSGNKSNYVQQSMEISPSHAHIIYEPTNRHTLCTTDLMDLTDIDNNNPYLKSKSSQNIMGNVTTQTSLDSFELQTPSPVFSSTRLPGTGSLTNRRRTLFNVDMDLINENINKINNTSQRRSLALANEAELGECRALTPLRAVTLPLVMDAIDKEESLTQPKMRRLFTPNDEVVVSPPKSNKKARSTSNSSVTCSSTKRRRTLATLTPTTAELDLQTDLKSAAKIELSKDVFVTPLASETSDMEAELHIDCELPPTAKRRPIHTLVHTNMQKEQVQVIHKTIRKLRGMRLDPTVTKRTTHLVSLEPRRTLNLLRGLMRGVWIVSYRWILESLRAGKWVPEEKFELTSFSRAVEICRTERQAFGVSYRCELFRYMETFYVSSLCRPITFNNIKELLLLGGAKITENRYKAKFIVGDKRHAEDDRVYLSPAWVLDSITAMQIQKFGKYLMKCAIITPSGIRYEDPREEPDETFRRNQRICYKDPALVINK